MLLFLFMFILKLAVPSVLRKVQNRNLFSKYGLIYVPNNDKFRVMLSMFLCMGKLTVVVCSLLYTRLVALW